MILLGFLFLPFTVIFFQSLLYPIGFSQAYEEFTACFNSTPFTCGSLNVHVTYPFRISGRPDFCGYPGFTLTCINGSSPRLYIEDQPYQVLSIDYMYRVLTIVNLDFLSNACPQYKNTTINPDLFEYTDRDQNLILHINCSSVVPMISDIGCVFGVVGRSYYRLDGEDSMFVTCKNTALVPLHQTAAVALKNNTVSFQAALSEGFDVRWRPGGSWCQACRDSGGACGYNVSSPADQTCYCSDKARLGSYTSSTTKKIAIGVGAGLFGFLLACGGFYFWYRRKKNRLKLDSSASPSRTASSNSPMKDLMLGSTHYQIPIFSYKELQEATDGFSPTKELGDGGFGTVYQGKLKDGRIVAVKRLHENNYKRAVQFMNEVEIHNRLRHQNLVALYGWTSTQSHDLLVVYEFVPNGTVADHVHGSLASRGALTWPIRMSIAMETADALAYLHAVEPQIIHRDVKTNNILLDNSFHVKVADFGLSRLFPAHATHVSTAPQGTPGYLDPEYYQCYQLTDKSDVYSFGVVLVELISSKPAIDITRDRQEINLASMALRMIQNDQLHELVDPGLGFHSDFAVRRRVTLVAELAFRCLQGEKEMRPSMEEVLNILRGIDDEVHKPTKPEVEVLVRDDATLLKNGAPFSPDSVTEKWESRYTTPSNSG